MDLLESQQLVVECVREHAGDLRQRDRTHHVHVLAVHFMDRNLAAREMEAMLSALARRTRGDDGGDAREGHEIDDQDSAQQACAGRDHAP